MKFKVDENLPIEIAELLRAVHHEASMVTEQGLSGEDDLHVVDVCRQEERIMVTLDLDFADVRAYPPKSFPGLMVIRVHWQDKHHIIETFRRAIPLLDREPVKHHLYGSSKKPVYGFGIERERTMKLLVRFAGRRATASVPAIAP